MFAYDIAIYFDRTLMVFVTSRFRNSVPIAIGIRLRILFQLEIKNIFKFSNRQIFKLLNIRTSKLLLHHLFKRKHLVAELGSQQKVHVFGGGKHVFFGVLD